MAQEYYKGVNGKRVKMTPEEVAAMLAEQAAERPEREAREAAERKEHAKMSEYAQKGWMSQMAIFEDMADRGVDVVLAELKEIKDRNA
jgi:hypothetical protein